MEQRFDDILAFADIGAFIEQPVKVYSSGMVVRLAFAVAACIDPDILIVDEALAVGDIMFQSRCLERIRQLRDQGSTILFVTHDTGTFQNLCDYGYLLNEGQIFSHGRPARVATQYYELMREDEHTRQRLAVADTTQTTLIQAEHQQREEEIRGKTTDQEYRFGTGAARITDYCVLDSTGKETATLQVGEPFRVVVNVTFQEYVGNLAIGIMFRNAQGQNLMGMHSYHENRVSFGPHQAGETLVITAEQQMLLNPNDYVLHISLADCRSDYDYTSLDYRDGIAKITVVGKTLAYGLVHNPPHFLFVSRGAEEEKPHSSDKADSPVHHTNASLPNYSLEQVKALYEQELFAPYLARPLERILAYNEAPPALDSTLEKEERSWPGEPRFVQIGYHRMMLGRYVFAGSQFCRNGHVLDTGCGLGWGTYLVAQYARQVTAFDIDATEIQRCREHWTAHNIRWLVGDTRDLRFLGQERFDVALGMEIIEHLTYADGARYIAEVAGYLRPEGVFIGTSAFPTTVEEAERLRSTNPFHLHIFTLAEMYALLERHFSRVSIIGGWMFIAVK